MREHQYKYLGVFIVVVIYVPLPNLYIFLCPADAKYNLFMSNLLWSLKTHLPASFTIGSPHTRVCIYIQYITYHKYLRGWMLGVNICPIWNVSGQHAVDKAPNHSVWDARLYYGCCLISWPDMNTAALNVYSHRIGLLTQVSRTLDRISETNFVSSGCRVAL